MLRWESACAKNSDSRAQFIVSDRIQTVSCKFVNLGASVDYLLLEWSVLYKEIKTTLSNLHFIQGLAETSCPICVGVLSLGA
jgi:hypothetical protein